MAKIKPCKCVELVNKELAKDNARLTRGFSIDISTKKMSIDTPIYLEVEKIDSKIRKPPTKVVATFCPFCGNRLQED